MNKPSGRDFNFVFYAFIAALLAMGFLLEVSKKLQSPPPPESSVMEAAAGLEIITPRQLHVLLKTPGEKPTLLFLYASWCPYCGQMMPDMQTLEKTHRVLFVSIDQDMHKLARYLLSQGYRFTPYVLSGSPAGQLRQLRSTYTGSIPYLALFDTEGWLVSERSGLISNPELGDWLRVYNTTD